MAIKASHAIICCAVIWLCDSSRLQARGSWSVYSARILPGRLKPIRRVPFSTSAWRSTQQRGSASKYSPSRHLLAAGNASAQVASGAACDPAFPLVEATISGVHAAFLAGTLNCSQLMAVRAVSR